jgi:hypothetical protein
MDAWLWMVSGGALIVVRAVAVVIVDVSRRRTYAMILRGMPPGTVWAESRPDGSACFYGDGPKARELGIRVMHDGPGFSRKTRRCRQRQTADRQGATVGRP